MYKKILSYRPSLRPSLVFLIIPVLVIFIFISKYFDQYSENGESKDQELENNLITVKDFLFNQFNSGVTKVELKVRNGETEIAYREFFMIKKFHLQMLTMLLTL